MTVQSDTEWKANSQVWKLFIDAYDPRSPMYPFVEALKMTLSNEHMVFDDGRFLRAATACCQRTGSRFSKDI